MAWEDRSRRPRNSRAVLGLCTRDFAHACSRLSSHAAALPRSRKFLARIDLLKAMGEFDSTRLNDAADLSAHLRLRFAAETHRP
eukprot:470349-Prymnesium_polylepis.1